MYTVTVKTPLSPRQNGETNPKLPRQTISDWVRVLTELIAFNSINNLEKASHREYGIDQSVYSIHAIEGASRRTAVGIYPHIYRHT